MEAKKVLLTVLLVGLILGFLVGFFFRPFAPQVLLSANSVYIEQLTGAGFGSDGELKKCYWVVTFTVDVFQSHFFILDKDFTYVGTNNITDTFQGKQVRPQSMINISFIPLEPYIIIKDPDTPADTILIIPKIYNDKGLPREKFDAFIATVYPFIQPYYYEIHTPFKVEVRKNNNLISSKVIDAIGVEKEFFLVGDESEEENARIDVAGKLGSGVNTAWGDFVWFGQDKVLRLQTSQGKDIREHLRYKSRTIQYNPAFPTPTEVPDYEAMANAGGTFFQYWVCGATTNSYEGSMNVYEKYNWHENPYITGCVDFNDPGNLSAVGTNRPPMYLYSYDSSGFSYVSASYCDQYPGWTKANPVSDAWGHVYYKDALYSPPSLTEDNPGTNPVGLSVYNWLIQQKGAYVSDLKGTYGTRTELKDDSVYIYYQPGTLGWDIASLRISTELADTYVYGEYVTNFGIQKAYWQSSGTDYAELSGGVPDYLIVDVKNTGNVSANAQLEVKAVYPSNFFDIVSIPANVISNTTITPGDVYTFKLQAVSRGTSSSFDFKLEISVWCEAYKRDTAYVIGRVLEASCTLRIYTIGDSANAKIWLNDNVITRNKGTYYEGILPKGTYTIKFEQLEGFNLPYITVNTVFAGYTSVQVTLNPGEVKNVVAYYVSSEVKLMVGFVSWSDKGIFGWSPTCNPLGTSRPTVPEWHVVRLIINATALGVVEGDLKIIILADVEGAFSYYAENAYHISLGSGASQEYSVDFMLGGVKGYYYMVQLGDSVIYIDYNADTRPEVFVTPWYFAYGLYIGIGITAIIAIGLALYYLKWRALTGVRY